MSNGDILQFPDSIPDEEMFAIVRKKFPPKYPRAENLTQGDFVPPTAERTAQAPVADPVNRYDVPPTVEETPTPLPRGPEQFSVPEAAVMGAVEEGTLGLESEIVAAYGSLKEAANKGSFDKISEQYNYLRDLEQKRLELAKEQQPGAYYTGAAAGMVATPLKVLQGAKLGAQVLKRTVAMGAVEGLGKSEAETPAGMAADVVTGAAVWGVGGKLTDVAMKYVGKAGDSVVVKAIENLAEMPYFGNVALILSKLKIIKAKKDAVAEANDVVNLLKKSIKLEKSPAQKIKLKNILVGVEEKLNVDKSIQAMQKIEERIKNIGDKKIRNIIDSEFKANKNQTVSFFNDPVAAFNKLNPLEKVAAASALYTGNPFMIAPGIAARVGKWGVKGAGSGVKKLIQSTPDKMQKAVSKYGNVTLLRVGGLMSKLTSKEAIRKLPDYTIPVFEELAKHQKGYREVTKALGLTGAGLLHVELLKNKQYRENVKKAIDYYGWDVTLMGNPKGNKNGK